MLNWMPYRSKGDTVGLLKAEPRALLFFCVVRWVGRFDTSVLQGNWRRSAGKAEPRALLLFWAVRRVGRFATSVLQGNCWRSAGKAEPRALPFLFSFLARDVQRVGFPLFARLEISLSCRRLKITRNPPKAKHLPTY